MNFLLLYASVTMVWIDVIKGFVALVVVVVVVEE